MKAIGYIRVSTDEQVHAGISLDHQRAKIEAYAKLHDISLPYGVLWDEGVSAKNIEGREGAKEVLDLAFRKEVDAVIVYKLDRLFRNTQEALDVSTKLNKEGVALHSVTERLDTESAMGRFFFTILAACAEMERNLIAERTKDALGHKRAKGEKYNHVPYGYREEDGKLLEDPDEQEIISIMKWDRSAGYTYQQIADRLNKSGVSTKSNGWIRDRYGKRVRGKAAVWQPQTVKNILDREAKRTAI